MINTEPAADNDYCPVADEWENPAYSLEKTQDAMGVCAHTVFGISALMPYQRLVIANILDAVHAADALDTTDCSENEAVYDQDGVLRAHQIILLPTGAGKSLCFEVPALLLDKPTLIIYPLLALMNDQFRSMEAAGITPVLFRGGQSTEERNKQYARLEGTDGAAPAKLIIANPEILNSKPVFERIKRRGVSHIAIDEAHCISEWGDSFRPAYLGIRQVIDALAPAAITAFTATAGKQVLARITDVLFDGMAHLVRSAADRPNLSYFVIQCRIKTPALLTLVTHEAAPMVVFCSSRKGTERTADMLRGRLGRSDIRFYHAGLERAEKIQVEKWFHSSDTGILVATCAWGMGVDKKNVRTVVHMDPSPTAEAYIQEAGRAGRDRQAARAFLLWSPDDTARIATLPEKQRIRAGVLHDYAYGAGCRRAALLKAVGDTPEDRGAGDAVFCSGCDVCSGTAQTVPYDEDGLLRVIRRTSRGFTASDLVALYTEDDGLWRAQDVTALLAALKKEKKLRQHTGLLWKYKLSCGRRQRETEK